MLNVGAALRVSLCTSASPSQPKNNTHSTPSILWLHCGVKTHTQEPRLLLATIINAGDRRACSWGLRADVRFRSDAWRASSGRCMLSAVSGALRMLLKCDFQKEKLGLIEKKKKDYFPFFVTVRYKTEPVIFINMQIIFSCGWLKKIHFLEKQNICWKSILVLRGNKNLINPLTDVK